MQARDPEIPILAIAGPTASGKSALALALAERLQGTVINADALQVYRELRVLSARPGPVEEARVPHRLYGVLPGAEACSAGRWRALALTEIDAARAAGRLPILAGGSGLYLKALEQGLAPAPPVPAAIKAAAAARPLATLHAELARRDPAMAARLQPTDRQRLERAWAVLEATGRSLADWQAEAGEPGPPLQWLVLLPPRERLRQAVAERWEHMLAEGALEEVRALLALRLAPELPVMKAVGVRELAAVLEGRGSLAEASAAAITATRQYLKRQTTWLRTQVLAGRERAVWQAEQFSDRIADMFAKKIRKDGLTG